MKRLLFIGDVCGKAGCDFLAEKLYGIKQLYGADITIVNAENSENGNGISRKSADRILKAGADVLTTGNHAFRYKDELSVYDEDYIIRPANFPEGGAPGKGVCLLDMGPYSIAVVNLMGTVSMEPLDNPFTCIDRILENISTPNIFLDFHAEATSEKKAMGHYLTGRVTGVFGTHTHVQTADEQILPGGTGYITDVGMCGSMNGILGVRTDCVVKKFTLRTPEKFEPAEGNPMIHGVLFTADEKTGRCAAVERICEK